MESLDQSTSKLEFRELRMQSDNLEPLAHSESQTPKIEWESFSPEYEHPGVFPFTEAN